MIEGNVIESSEKKDSNYKNPGSNDELQEPANKIIDQEPTTTTKYGRILRKQDRFVYAQCHLFTQGHNETEYIKENGTVIAKTIHHFNNTVYRISLKVSSC
jgi:hypothetical protein